MKIFKITLGVLVILGMACVSIKDNTLETWAITGIISIVISGVIAIHHVLTKP